MKIYVNGDEVAVADDATLADVVSDHAPSTSGVAAAVGMEVIPRSLWAETPINDDDKVEIVTAAAGG